MWGAGRPENLGNGAPVPREPRANPLGREVCVLAHVPIFGGLDPPERRAEGLSYVVALHSQEGAGTLGPVPAGSRKVDLE